ncbi:MAG TPA: hypothetical protein VG734_05580 [Lacunisphaera sp.]|nr:hypothetical protein [Lacunisphaera sp.]
MRSKSNCPAVVLLLLFASQVVVVLGAEGRTAGLCRDISLTPPSGWESTSPFPAVLGEGPYATLKFVAKDGRNAVMIVTLLPDDLLGFRVEDQATLQQFTAAAAQAHVPPTATLPQLDDFALEDGIGVQVTVKRWPTPSRYRFTTIVCALIGAKHLVHCAIFHDGAESTEFVQAFEAILSAHSVDD